MYCLIVRTDQHVNVKFGVVTFFPLYSHLALALSRSPLCVVGHPPFMNENIYLPELGMPCNLYRISSDYVANQLWIHSCRDLTCMF